MTGAIRKTIKEKIYFESLRVTKRYKCAGFL